jgi:sugar phosphate isomerase/epimerase
MKIGIFLQSLFGFDENLFNKENFAELLNKVVGVGVECIELGISGDERHWNNASRLLNNQNEREKILDIVTKSGLEISALNCGGNPLHPDLNLRERDIKKINDSIILANLLNIDKIITFSGCPGEFMYPNWIVYPGMEDVLEKQWEEITIPFWKTQETFAREYGVKICLELHPVNIVYNTETFLKLRKSTGENLGINLDPSHLVWQGIDSIKVIHDLNGFIFHTHAKDTKVNKVITSKNGLLDNKVFFEKGNRSWIFRTVGYGQSRKFWEEYLETLKLYDYNGVLSIEQEDRLFSFKEGFERGVKFLKGLLSDYK